MASSAFAKDSFGFTVARDNTSGTPEKGAESKSTKWDAAFKAARKPAPAAETSSPKITLDHTKDGLEILQVAVTSHTLSTSSPQQLLLDLPSHSQLSPNHLKQLKRLARLGIPQAARPNAWFQMSGGAAKQASFPAGYYRQLSASTSNISDDVLFAVEEDTTSAFYTFHLHRLFSTAKGTEALSRILLAYAQYNPNGGYVKGMHQVAALLLVVFGLSKEEEAFWTFAALLEDKLYPYCQGQVAHGAKVEQRVLGALVVQKAPLVARHLANLRLDVSAVSAPWFSTLFTSSLAPEIVVRIWDCMFCEGAKVLLRVALALIKKYEPAIVGCSDAHLLRKVLDTRISRMLMAEADELLSWSFKSFGGLGTLRTSTVSSLRQAAIVELQKQASGRTDSPLTLPRTS